LEVEVTVAEYFAMLRAELAGVPYSKAEHNRRVQRLLQNRSKAAVEYKFQNISAVLVNHGYVYVKGYVPAQNYQAALETSVLEWLDGNDDLADVMLASEMLNPRSPVRVGEFSELLTAPPEQKRAARRMNSPAPRRVDFCRLDADNRRLGAAGEEYIVEVERRRLHDDEGRPDLARKIRWVSRDDGDGLGYDVASFEGSGVPRLIEVKTTGCPKYFPFFVTANELFVSRQQREHYHLYRLFDFGERAGLYVLPGALDETCSLAPATFRATASVEADGKL
jgi:hypothetical protein